MGNSQHRDPDLKVHIETSKPFYNSGSTIQGVVFVQALKNFTFDALYIRIQGDQWCQWFQGSSRNRKKYTGNQNFYVVEHVLEKYKQKHLQKGSYAYPFAFQLSQNIPGTFLPSKYDAKIQYKMAAYFVDFSNNNSTQIQYLPLIIRQPFRQQIIPYQGTVQRSPKTCFCFDQGTIIIHAWFQRNVAYQGQYVKVQVTADNKFGKNDLNTFMIELVQYTFVCSNNGVHRTYSKVISSHKVNQHVKIHDKKTFQYDLKIPEVNHQTSISTLVANYYRIQVSSKTSNFASQDPCIYAPLFILKKDFKNLTTEQPLKINKSMSGYKTNKPKFFAAPQHWFRKNKNLPVSLINFKLQDQLGISQDQL